MDTTDTIRILLVDDNLSFLESAANFLLTFPEISVVGKAQSGEEAIGLVQKRDPDLVLLDLAMPGMSGLETLRRFKELRHPPFVIIVTLHDDLEYRASAQDAGADGFISKSQIGDRLMPLIQKLFLEKGPA